MDIRGHLVVVLTIGLVGLLALSACQPRELDLTGVLGDDDGSNSGLRSAVLDTTGPFTPMQQDTTLRPQVPADLAADLLDSTQIQLSWNPPGGPATAIELQRAVGDAPWSDWRTVPADAAGTVDSDLISGSLVRYRVRTVREYPDQLLSSPWSAEVAALSLWGIGRGDQQWRGEAFADGNQVETWTSNWGLVGNVGEDSFIWPAGNQHNEYMVDLTILVGSEVEVPGGDLVQSVVTCKSPRGNDDLSPIGEHWGFEPVPEFGIPGAGDNPVQMAVSDDPSTWPSSWPGLPAAWDGVWRGLRGPGEVRAAWEGYTVIDDSNDREFIPDGLVPLPGDSSRGGLGLRVEMRVLQYDQPEYEDVILFHYTLHNDGALTLDPMRFGVLPGTVIGGRLDAMDDIATYYTEHDLAVFTDEDDVSNTTGWVPVDPDNGIEVGALGVAFLQTPGDLGLTSADYFDIGGMDRLLLRNDDDCWNRLTPGTFDDLGGMPVDGDALMGCGEFTLAPGEATEIVVAVIFGVDTGAVIDSLPALHTLRLYDWMAW